MLDKNKIILLYQKKDHFDIFEFYNCLWDWFYLSIKIWYRFKDIAGTKPSAEYSPAFCSKSLGNSFLSPSSGFYGVNLLPSPYEYDN
jgi:hypothetical protein